MRLGNLEHLIYEQLNSSKVVYGLYDGNPNFKTLAIRRLVLDKDMWLASLIAATPGQPERTLYKVQTTIVGQQGLWLDVPSTQSEVTSVSIVTTNRGEVVGEKAPAEKIVNWIKHPSVYGGVDVVEGYYDVQQNQILYSGQTLKFVTYNIGAAHPDNPADATLHDNYILKSPDNFRDVLANLVLAEVLSKPGGNNELAAVFDKLAQTALQSMIRPAPVPIFSEMQETRKV